MANIVMGTTPTITYRFKIVSPAEIRIAILTIVVNSKTVLIRKTLDDAIIGEDFLAWKLTQEETLALGTKSAKMMLNWYTADGNRGVGEEATIKGLGNHIPEVIGDGSDIIPIGPSSESSGAVIPQTYGAVGDGVTDDTDAIQSAINSGKPVYIPQGRYLVTEPIVITDKVYWNFYARDATFVYNGADYAIRILGAENCHIEIGQITTMNGGGIEFHSDNTTEWNQYVSLEFNQIECRTDCIHIEVKNDGWCNENQVYGGRFKAGENGVHVHHDGENYTNGWKFYNCGIEGVTNGFLFDANEGKICNMVIANARYGESFETILKTIGFVFDCLWIAPSYITSNIIECSSQTSRFEILAPIRTIWDGDSIRHRGCIIDGKLMAEKTEYEEVT